MAIGATAVWRVRPSGVNTNGGGYDPGIAGAATDYSRQNAPQASGTNGATSGAGSTTFTDSTAAAFTSAMIGNCIQIASGTNFQAGFYFVTAFTNANSVVLDRTPSSGGAGAAGVWKLGGGWANFWTNTTVAKAAVVSGNIIYILGSGTPNPSSYVYDYDCTTAAVPPNSDGVNGLITFANDPSTPGYKAPPDTTGGMPVIKINDSGTGIAFNNVSGGEFNGLWFVGTANFNGGGAGISLVGGTPGTSVFGCVLDQFGFDGFFVTNGFGVLVGCEAFSSVGAGAGTRSVLNTGGVLLGCNIHDWLGLGVTITTGSIINSIIAKCGSTGIKFNSSNTNLVAYGNTIDGNGGHGIELPTQQVAYVANIVNNIISNHTGVSKSGIVVNAGTATQNRSLAILIDYNTFYNNTANYTAITAGPHDTALGVTPYVGQSTENYALA